MAVIYGTMKDKNGNILRDKALHDKLISLESQISSIETTVAGTAPVEVVDDIAARNALSSTKDVIVGTLCWVKDASADATVTANAACYICVKAISSGTTGTDTDWSKVAEVESLDVDNGTIAENGVVPSGLTASGFFFEKDAAD